ncbi:MAG: hypothetical protein NVSMB51_11610 [Solirubrobacteraceae bacterium]
MRVVPVQPTLLRRTAAALLVAVMVLGGFVLWLGVPVLWLWVASQLASGTAPTIGPYLLVAFAIPISMVAMARLLRQVDLWHSRLINRDTNVRVQMPWMKSLRGERETKRHTTVLDTIMLGTAICAVVAMGVWFLVAAGNPLPQ